jgi:hypothetical protein
MKSTGLSRVSESGTRLSLNGFLVMGREQAASGYRGVSGHGKTRAIAAPGCGEQRRTRSLRQLVSRPMPLSKGSINPQGRMCCIKSCLRVACNR